ncbi:EmrB/QacA subfamily drug resistance transporter [Microbacterium keratanolyticum]|uniref:MFS transporter n=1 Tax=Microbacterium keratanolyticum TaxID=67574 RepID=A0A9W6HUW5_9MICO|nr:MFS transporter [Microbacterium keratanolyticum]MBM7468088.1 EmrB/QacA subfamily drug resistance transporter [Microbacterium keratanolyticum]GLK03078.1 MFS transporter [Microbacterium keratanolyticum]
MSAPAAPRSVRMLVVCLMASMLVVSFNQTVLNTALPTIVAELGGLDRIGWISAAFVLTTALTMPLAGALADVVDRRGLLLGASAIFAAGTLLGGLAWNLDALIIARLIQGAGGGAVMVLTQTIMAASVPARERAKYAGAFGSVWAIATTSGVLIGGWLTDGPGWRWLFWGTLPLVVVAMLLSLRFIPRDAPSTQRLAPDLAGMMLLCIATTALVTATSGSLSPEWSWMTAAIGIGAILALVFAERRAEQPVLPGVLFRSRTFVLATVAGMLCSGVSSFVVLAYLPTFAQMVLGLSAFQAGTLLLPMIVATVAASTLTGFAVTRTGRYILIPAVGAGVVGVGLILLGTLTADSTPLQLALSAALLGAGIGTNVLLLTLLAQNAIPARNIGVATAANNFVRQAGATMGISLIGVAIAARLSTAMTDALQARALSAPDGLSFAAIAPEDLAALSAPYRDAIAEAYAVAIPPLFLFLAPLAFLAMIMIIALERRPLADGHD